MTDVLGVIAKLRDQHTEKPDISLDEFIVALAAVRTAAVTSGVALQLDHTFTATPSEDGRTVNALEMFAHFQQLYPAFPAALTSDEVAELRETLHPSSMADFARILKPGNGMGLNIEIDDDAFEEQGDSLIFDGAMWELIKTHSKKWNSDVASALGEIFTRVSTTMTFGASVTLIDNIVNIAFPCLPDEVPATVKHMVWFACTGSQLLNVDSLGGPFSELIKTEASSKKRPWLLMIALERFVELLWCFGLLPHFVRCVREPTAHSTYYRSIAHGGNWKNSIRLAIMTSARAVLDFAMNDTADAINDSMFGAQTPGPPAARPVQAMNAMKLYAMCVGVQECFPEKTTSIFSAVVKWDTAAPEGSFMRNALLGALRVRSRLPTNAASMSRFIREMCFLPEDFNFALHASTVAEALVADVLHRAHGTDVVYARLWELIISHLPNNKHTKLERAALGRHAPALHRVHTEFLTNLYAMRQVYSSDVDFDAASEKTLARWNSRTAEQILSGGLGTSNALVVNEWDVRVANRMLTASHHFPMARAALLFAQLFPAFEAVTTTLEHDSSLWCTIVVAALLHVARTNVFAHDVLFAELTKRQIAPFDAPGVLLPAPLPSVSGAAIRESLRAAGFGLNPDTNDWTHGAPSLEEELVGHTPVPRTHRHPSVADMLRPARLEARAAHAVDQQMRHLLFTTPLKAAARRAQAPHEEELVTSVTPVGETPALRDEDSAYMLPQTAPKDSDGEEEARAGAGTGAVRRPLSEDDDIPFPSLNELRLLEEPPATCRWPLTAEERAAIDVTKLHKGPLASQTPPFVPVSFAPGTFLDVATDFKVAVETRDAPSSVWRVALGADTAFASAFAEVMAASTNAPLAARNVLFVLGELANHDLSVNTIRMRISDDTIGEGRSMTIVDDDDHAGNTPVKKLLLVATHLVGIAPGTSITGKKTQELAPDFPVPHIALALAFAGAVGRSTGAVAVAPLRRAFEVAVDQCVRGTAGSAAALSDIALTLLGRPTVADIGTELLQHTHQTVTAIVSGAVVMARKVVSTGLGWEPTTPTMLWRTPDENKPQIDEGVVGIAAIRAGMLGAAAALDNDLVIGNPRVDDPSSTTLLAEGWKRDAFSTTVHMHDAHWLSPNMASVIRTGLVGTDASPRADQLVRRVMDAALVILHPDTRKTLMRPNFHGRLRLRAYQVAVFAVLIAIGVSVRQGRAPDAETTHVTPSVAELMNHHVLVALLGPV